MPVYDTDATLAIAQIMLNRKNLPEAGARFERVLGRSPNNADAVIGLGFVRLNEKRFGEASTLLARGRTMVPGRPDVEEGYRSAKFWGLMAQASAALDDNRADKRDRLIDALLETPEYGYYFANRWADVLRVKRGNNNQGSRIYATFALRRPGLVFSSSTSS